MAHDPLVSQRRRDRGFTLLEMLVVVAIVAIMAAVSLPSIGTYIRNYKIKGASQEVAGEVTSARSKAIMSNTNAGVSFVAVDADSYRWVHEDLAAGEQLGLLKDLPIGIRFVASGTANAGPSHPLSAARRLLHAGPGALRPERHGRGGLHRSRGPALQPRADGQLRRDRTRRRHGDHAARREHRPAAHRAHRPRRPHPAPALREKTMNAQTHTLPRRSEAGFTLVEALVAIVVLIFGLMAVTNLLLVAASSNTVANQGTAAVTAATQVMDFLKVTTFDTLDTGPVGTPFDASDGGSDCNDPALLPAEGHCTTVTQGVGTVHVHWYITPMADPRLLLRPRAFRGNGCARRRPLARGVHDVPRVHQRRPGDGRLPRRTMRPEMQNERGFSLVELIVAMTVTLIVSSAIYGLLAAGGNAFSREPEVADRQQNIRAAMDLITRDVYGAGAALQHLLAGVHPQRPRRASAPAASTAAVRSAPWDRLPPWLRAGDDEDTDVLEIVSTDEQCPQLGVCSTAAASPIPA